MIIIESELLTFAIVYLSAFILAGLFVGLFWAVYELITKIFKQGQSHE